VTVIDVTGMNFTTLSGDVLTFLKQVAQYRERHYPKRAAKIFILNVQSWFHHIWTLVSQFLDPGTARKVEFVADEKEIAQKLSECISLDQVRIHYTLYTIHIHYTLCISLDQVTALCPMREL
jgi:hypothetical protein